MYVCMFNGTEVTAEEIERQWSDRKLIPAQMKVSHRWLLASRWFLRKYITFAKLLKTRGGSDSEINYWLFLYQSMLLNVQILRNVALHHLLSECGATCSHVCGF